MVSFFVLVLFLLSPGVSTKPVTQIPWVPPGSFVQETRTATPEVQPTVSGCTTLINEVFVDPASFFVEIFRQCTTLRAERIDRPLRDHKVLIIAENPLRVILAATLDSPELGFRKEEKHFVFGTSSDKTFVSNLAAKGVQAVPSAATFKFERSKNYILVLLASQNRVVLNQVSLYLGRNGYESMTLSEQGRARQLVVSSTVDILPFCSGKCDTVSESTLGFLKDVETSMKITLVKSPIALEVETSLNFCSDNLRPADIQNHRYGKVTPGRANFCEGVMPSVCQHIFSGNYAQEYPETLRGKKWEITKGSYQRLFSCESSAKSIKSRDTCQPDRLHLKYNRPKQLEVLQTWVQQTLPEVNEQCKATLPHNGRLLDRDWISSWLQMRKPEEKCIYTCTACELFFQLGLRPDYKRKQNIASGGYYARAGFADNQQAVLDHDRNHVHQIAVTLVQDLKTKSSPAEMAESLVKVEEAECEFLLPTLNMGTLVLAEILTDSSFNSHNVFVEAQKFIGTNIGIHHYYGLAATEMCESFSKTMHTNMLSELVKAQIPFSLIVDASTDITNKPLLACLIQTLENNSPIVYFYKVVHLTTGESAREIYTAFMEQVQSDDAIVGGFTDFVKAKLECVITDNANVMTGENESFFARMRNFSGRKIRKIGCMAHKVELAIQRAIKKKKDEELQSFYKFECKCNEFYTFYMSRGSKRFQNLESIALAESGKCSRLKRFYEVRWASSHLSVLEAVYENIIPMSKSLPDLLETTNMRENARNTANDLLNYVTDKAFVIIVVEFIDMLTVFKFLSLELQKGPGLIVEKYDIMHENIKKLHALKIAVGPKMSTFLESCSCHSVCAKSRCTLTHYEKCTNPICAGKEYKDIEKPPIKHSDARKVLYDSLVEEIQEYFDMEMLRQLRVFDLKVFGFLRRQNLEDSNFPKNFKTDFVKLCQNFFKPMNETCESAFSSYKSLIYQLHAWRTEFLPFGEDLSKLWKAVLESEKIQLSYTVRNFIEIVLITPFGSSDAERIFSIVNRVKTKGRASLTPRTVEDVVRLRFHGPKTFKDWWVYYYMKEYLSNHYRSDDPTNVRKESMEDLSDARYISSLF